MAYGHFEQAGDGLPEEGKVIPVQIVAGIDAKAMVHGHLCGPYIRGYSHISIGVVTAGVIFGVEFHPICAGIGGGGYHTFHWICEDGDAYARSFEHFYYTAQVCLLIHSIPTMIGGELAWGIGYEGDLGGLYLQHQLHEFVFFRIAFYIELGGNDFAYLSYIAVPDMPFIGAGVNGDAIGAKLLAVYGGLQHIGVVAAAAVAEGGYFVDVYGEFCHNIAHFLKKNALFL